MGLRETTLRLLGNLPRTITAKQVAEGAGLSEAWLSRFASGTISDPGVDKVQALHDHLASLLKA
jgi:transcriptional regulator with XRE-family HTH domain